MTKALTSAINLCFNFKGLCYPLLFVLFGTFAIILWFSSAAFEMQPAFG